MFVGTWPVMATSTNPKTKLCHCVWLVYVFRNFPLKKNNFIDPTIGTFSCPLDVKAA